MTERRLISSGSTFEAEIGYSRAVVNGDWVHVSGTTGYDYAAMTISPDVAEQAEQCLRNIQAALTEADSSLDDVVRVRYLLPHRVDFETCQPILRRWFGEIRPAATMMVCGLADPEIRIEIEVDARRRPTDPVADSATDLAIDQAADSAADPVADLATVPANDPVTDSATVLANDPVADSATDPATDLATDPATDPAAA
jgi:enamine deaminase RidA (YjgF/YER057c/UK114 family)